MRSATQGTGAGVVLFVWVSLSGIGAASSSSPTSDDVVKDSDTLERRLTTNEQYCAKIVTGSGASNDGYMKITIEGTEEVGPNTDHSQNAVVFDKCYPAPLNLTVLGPKDNAWAGSARFSSDHGVHWMDMRCADCGTGSGPVGKLIVENDANGADQGAVTCLNGDPCTLEMANERYCILVTTGGASGNGGFLKVSVGGTSTVTGTFSENKVVYSQCHSAPVSLIVENNANNDAWTGSARSSSDHGVHWFDMRCKDCTEGEAAVGLVVDGDSDGVDQGAAACLGGAQCTIEMVCSGFECGTGYVLKGNATTIPGHTRDVCCNVAPTTLTTTLTTLTTLTTALTTTIAANTSSTSTSKRPDSAIVSSAGEVVCSWCLWCWVTHVLLFHVAERR